MSTPIVAEKKKSLITPQLLVILVLLSAGIAVLSQVAQMYTPLWASQSLAIAGNIPYLVMFLALIIANIFPEKISSQHIVLITAVSCIATFCSHHTFLMIFDCFASARTAPTPLPELMGWYLGPFDITYANQLNLGGLNDVPWMVWLPTLAWWIMYTIVWHLFNLSFLSIVRRRWVDIELLPYPMSYEFTIPIVAAAPERRLKGMSPERRFKFYLGGLALGFFYMWPPVLKYIIPWLPDLYGWTGPMYYGHLLGSFDVSLIPTLNKFIALYIVNTNLAVYAMYMIMPLDILLSAWVTCLSTIIIAQILYLRGYYSGAPSTGMSRYYFLGQEGPLKLYAVHSGAFIGLIAIWLILNWRYIASTIKSAISGPTPEELENEAIPYRVAWVIFAGCIILLLLLYYVAGTGWTGAVLLILSWFLISIGGARMFGLTFCTGATNRSLLLGIPQLPFIKLAQQGILTREMANTLFLSTRPTGLVALSSAFVGMWYKIARDTNTRVRDVFIAMLIASVVGAFTAFFVTLKIYYKVGLSYTIRGNYGGWFVSEHSTNVACLQWPAFWPWWKQYLAGITLTCILSYLRMRFVWWPIDPVGAILGFGIIPFIPIWQGGTYLQFFTPLISWLVKYIVIRIGGVRIHDEIFIPLLAGFAVGSALAWAVGGMAAIPRYLMA